MQTSPRNMTGWGRPDGALATLMVQTVSHWGLMLMTSVLVALTIASASADSGTVAADAETNKDGGVASEAAISVSVADGSVTEGEDYSLRITLSEASSVPVTVATYTRPDSAINGSDFYGFFKKLEFAVGETELLVPVFIIDDDEAEDEEVFKHYLVNASVAIERAEATTTIIDNDSSTGDFESMRNRQEKFVRYENVPSDQLRLQDLTEPVSPPDNGSVGDGQFRIACEYSHFGMDDPIVKPGQPGAAHLHMFFGNTAVDGRSTNDSLVNTGGGTCNGFELNRSGYWTPALLDGRGNAVVPDSIIVYYKTKNPATAQRMPQGLKIIAGNVDGDDFQNSHQLHWSCGGSGGAYNYSNRIPECGGDYINATIEFPQCWDGRNLDSSDHQSHMAYIGRGQQCPSTHPVELPQITILLYYPAQSSVAGFYLSSDRHMGKNAEPGATLHADWWGGWNDEAMDLWIQGCIRNARNCSFGQTGTPRRFTRLNGLQVYEGPNLIPLP